MIYIKDQRASVWSVEDKGNYTQVKLGTSRKDKQSGEFKNSTWSFVRFVGEAHKKAADLKEKDRITIKAGGLNLEPYTDKSGERAWPKSPQFVVFDFEMFEATPSNKMDTPPSVEEGEELPF